MKPWKSTGLSVRFGCFDLAVAQVDFGEGRLRYAWCVIAETDHKRRMEDSPQAAQIAAVKEFRRIVEEAVKDSGGRIEGWSDMELDAVES